MPETPPTMRTLIGVDADGLYRSAIDLLGRLGFAGNQATLAHFDSTITPVGVPIVYDFADSAEVQERIKDLGENLLEASANSARAAGLGEFPTTIYALGNSSSSLLDLADTDRADLVAIGSRKHGALESFFLGSVGRALAIGAHQSFLIARGVRKAEGPVRAIFATDHSDYAKRCFNRLLDMNPKGLEHVTIVTATESSIDSSFGSEMGYDDRTPYSISEAEDRMRAHGDEMVARLAAKDISAEFHLVEGYPAEVLRQEMEARSADLLILAARGHGLIERILIGSLALHIVVAEPYSVLVLRLPD
jgi:nucleotide-binding universal stress UspA family protein